MKIDINRLTLGELEFIEEYCGQRWADAANDGGSKFTIALVYIMGRRDNPEYTIDDARNVEVLEVNWGLDPVPPGDAAESENSPSSPTGGE